MKLFKSVLMLVAVFTLLSTTGNVVLAGSVTAGLGLYSAAMTIMPKGLAFDLVVPTIPNFTGKTDAEVKDLGPDEMLAYRKAEKEFEVATMKAYFMETMKTEMGKDNVDKDAITKLSDTLDTITKEHVEWAKEIKAMKEAGDKAVLSHGAQLNKFIEDNIEELQKIQKAGQGHITFKAPAPITTGSALNPDGIPEIVGVQQAAPGNVNLKGSIVEGLVTNFPTSQAAYAYTDTVPKDGDYTFVAEGVAKPQIDFKIETRYAEPVKVAAYEVLTEESVKDIPNLQNIAQNYLRAKHDLKKQNGILFGDGIAPNPKGATVYGRVFSAGAMALAVTTPNFMDVVNACITDIYTTHNYTDEVPYMANIVMVNPVDFYIQMVSAKDLNGLPLYPTASLFNRVTLGGVTIIPFEDIPAGKIFCADLSKYNTTSYVDYEIRIGWINDQLITNQFTMVGESRFHAFVKKLDEQAFIYDDIATIQVAITKP